MAILNHWDPFSEIARLQDQFARARDWAPEARRAPTFAPAVDIFETKDAIVLKAELPGVKPEEVNVNVENNVLTVSGERKLEARDEREGYHRVERTYGTFTRSFAVPNNVAADAVEAELTEGVLTVRLPKKAEAQPKKVTVRAGSPASSVKPSQPS